MSLPWKEAEIMLATIDSECKGRFTVLPWDSQIKRNFWKL
jgi:hypothetical protein